jgi:MFS superfamily sulfate permease-like transporter
MEQLMERPVGPRHAKKVTKIDRLKWALKKGPARWDLKTYIATVAMSLFLMIAIGVAVGVAVFAVLTNQSH